MNGIIEEILDSLSEEKLQATINDPIDRAVKTFHLRLERVDNHREFIRILGAFFQHLYRYGLQVPRHLTDTEAKEEAVWFIEKQYKSENVRGYDAAFEDAVCNRQLGIKSVLGQVAASVKDHEREKYISWVLTRHIDPSDWQLRMQLTEEYLQRHGRLWPAQVQAFQPYLLAHSLQDLLQTHVSSTPTVSSPQLR